MIWPITFEERLADWANLKQQSESLDLENALRAINDWWFRAPMVNHHIHRDDVHNWPDPWQLLDDNLFCDLARALGIVYTIMAIERSDITEISIICTENDNLVQVNGGLYILNWSPGEMLNILSQDFKVKKIISSKQLEHKYN